MRFHLHILSVSLISIFLFNACGEKNVRSEPRKQTSSTKNTQIKDDDRGFDPCLLNAKLAVCTNNETVNSK